MIWMIFVENIHKHLNTRTVQMIAQNKRTPPLSRERSVLHLPDCSGPDPCGSDLRQLPLALQGISRFRWFCTSRRTAVGRIYCCKLVALSAHSYRRTFTHKVTGQGHLDRDSRQRISIIALQLLTRAPAKGLYTLCLR